MSIGGAGANGYNINDDSGSNFARFLWGAFGPSLAEWTDNGGPRPFGDAVVDGFDLDIESKLTSPPVRDGTTITDYQSSGWAAMAETFKNELYPQDTSKSYYTSAAPQCVVPDAHLSDAITSAWFDFIFVQFYNTPECSARAALSSSTGFTGYQDWTQVSSFNADVKIYVGLAANASSAASSDYYLTVGEVQTLISEVYADSSFGGIMLWEASTSQNNVICDKDYGTWMKQILEAQDAGITVDTTTSPCPAKPISANGLCGGYNGQTCVGSMFGSCCSAYGYCGDSAAYCTEATCDTTGGVCGTQYINATSSSSSSSAVSSSATSSASGSTAASTSSSVTGVSTSASGAVVSPIATDGSGSVVFSNGTSTGVVGAVGASSTGTTAMTTSTVTGTVSRTITTTNGAGEQTVYVTEDITMYTTICPITAAEATQTASSSSTPVNVDYVPSTKTLYSTSVVTVTSCAPTVTDCPARTEEQSTVTITSSYAVGTTVVYVVGNSQSWSQDSTTTSTTTVQEVSTIYSTITRQGSSALVDAVATSSSSLVESSVLAISSSVLANSSSVSPVSSSAAISSSAGPYTYGNGTSSAAVSGTISTTVVEIITAIVAPVEAQATSVAVVVSSAYGNATGTGAYKVNSTSSSTFPVYTGAAAGRIEFGAGAVALAIGAMFAL